MAEVGVFLSSEEHGAVTLVEQAKRAEEAGFRSLLISDHYHPWTDAQGESPFVWGVIGAIAGSTAMRVTTGVTCPTVRIHPVVLAQAAATAQSLLSGRFVFGVGSGEALNEHVLGDRWPSAPVRLEMLEEAIEVIRILWEGGNVRHDGRYYSVDNARIYSRPDSPPPIPVSAFGPASLALAARVGDGLVTDW
jgi:G6PDH family F420-dependent oxidoreductase